MNLNFAYVVELLKHISPSSFYIDWFEIFYEPIITEFQIKKMYDEGENLLKIDPAHITRVMKYGGKVYPPIRKHAEKLTIAQMSAKISTQKNIKDLTETQKEQIIDILKSAIQQDNDILQSKKQKLLFLAANKTFEKFLAAVVLYTFTKDNKANSRNWNDYDMLLHDDSPPSSYSNPKLVKNDGREGIDKVLNLHDASYPLTSPLAQLYPLAHNLPTILTHYLPRTEESKLLMNSLSRGHKQVFVTSDAPGVGKTEFVIAFASSKKAKKQFEFFYSTYDTSIKKTILGLHFQGWSPNFDDLGQKKEKTLEQQYEEKLELLSAYSSNSVLIVDNFDGDTETLLAELNTLPNLDMRLIFTTRTHLQGKETIFIPTFDSANLLKLIGCYLNGRHIEETVLHSIVEEIDCNTLLADIIGRLLGDEFLRIDPEALLTALKSNKWTDTNLSEQISGEYLRDNTPKTAFNHLSTLFDVSKLNTNLCHILSCSCFLPTEGIDINQFYAYLLDLKGCRQMVRYLCDTGWIKYEKRQQIVKLHPMVRSVCLHNEPTRPRWPQFQAFLKRLMDQRPPSFEDWNKKLIMLHNSNVFLAEKKTEDVSATVAYAMTSTAIGDIYDDLGDYHAALTYKEAALSDLQKIRDNPVDNLINVYISLAETESFLWNYQKAYSYANQVLELGEKHLSQENPLLVECYLCVGRAYGDLAMFEEACKYIKKAVNICENTNLTDSDKLALCYGALASSYYDLAEYSNAETYAKKRLVLRQEAQPTNELSIAAAHDLLGIIYSAMGLFSDALNHKKNSLEIRERLLPKNHPQIAVSYNNVGLAYFDLGDYTSALSYLNHSLDIKESILKANDPELAICYSNIGDIYLAMDGANITPEDSSELFKKARRFKKRALSIYQVVLPGNHPTLADVYSDMGVVHSYAGDFYKALEYEQMAKDIYEKCYAEDHPARAAIYRSIAGSLCALKKFDEALQYALKSAFMFSRIYALDHMSTASAFEVLGDIYRAQNSYDAAINAYNKALEGYENTLTHNHPDLSLFYAKQVSFYIELHRFEKALEFAHKDLSIQEASQPSNQLNIASVLFSIGYLTQKLKKFEQSLEYRKRALDLRKKILPENHIDIAHSHDSIGEAYQALGNDEKAFEFWEKAIVVWDQVLSETDCILAEKHAYLARKYKDKKDFQEAIKHYNRAIAIMAVSPSPVNYDLYDECCTNLGNIYATLGDSAKAIEYWEKGNAL